MKTRKMTASLVALAILGSMFGMAVPANSASSDTVCCYRWWGNASKLWINRNTYKASPRVSEVDWARVYIASETPAVEAHVMVNEGFSAKFSASGGVDAWVTANGAGTAKKKNGELPYANCAWLSTKYNRTQPMYCEMKLRK